MKNTTKFIVATLFLAQAAFSCPDWAQNVSYAEGEQITYQGAMYVAARDVAPNTAPNPSDNGWFWAETTVSCDNTVKVDADVFNVNTHTTPSEPKLFDLDANGLELTHAYPTGGGTATTLDYTKLSQRQNVTVGYSQSDVTASSVNVTSRYRGVQKTTKLAPAGVTTDGKYSSVQGRSAGTLDGDELTLANTMGTATLSASSGLVVGTSFGSVAVNDHGIQTTKVIEGGAVVSGGINMNQKVAEFEARIAALESALNAALNAQK